VARKGFKFFFSIIAPFPHFHMAHAEIGLQPAHKVSLLLSHYDLGLGLWGAACHIFGSAIEDSGTGYSEGRVCR